MSDFNERVIAEFRGNGGHVENFGDRLVLLHHTGAKSGAERISPVAAIPDGDSWLIAASKGGAPDNPGWFHNLLSSPDAVVETPDGVGGVTSVPVRATRLEGEERDAAWARFTAMSSGFADYEKKTTRVIPVLRLARA